MVDQSGINSEPIDLTNEKDGGVLKEIIKYGEGDEFPLKGDKVLVHYTGTLESDGTKFDSSRDRDEPFEFTLGKGEVIKAWDLGVASMKKGEIAKFTCRSDYAYKADGFGKIPPNATLIFEIEFIDWKGEDLSSKKDGSIIRRCITSGEGYQTPNEGALVDIHIIGRANGNVFDERDVKFVIGEGFEHNIPEGLEKALERFTLKEKSLIKLKPKSAFGSAGKPEIGVPPGTDISYEVEMKNFEKAKESWDMDQEEKVDQAKLCKEKGTSYFKDGKYRMAVKQYKKIVDYLQYDSGLSDDKKVEYHDTLLAGHLNLSLCYIKMDDFIHAKDNANKAISMDSNNVKGHFRRGQAFLALNEYELAQKDFETCLKLESGNKAAIQQLKICSGKIKAQKEKDKKTYCGMFERFAKIDTMNASANAYSDVLSGNVGEWSKSEGKEEYQDSSDDNKDSEVIKNMENVDIINTGTDLLMS